MNVNGVNIGGAGYGDKSGKPGVNPSGGFGELFGEKLKSLGAAQAKTPDETQAELNALSLLKGLSNDDRRAAAAYVQKGMSADEAVHKRQTEKMTAVAD